MERRTNSTLRFRVAASIGAHIGATVETHASHHQGITGGYPRHSERRWSALRRCPPEVRSCRDVSIAAIIFELYLRFVSKDLGHNFAYEVRDVISGCFSSRKCVRYVDF
jgi:hypothetical protein